MALRWATVSTLASFAPTVLGVAILAAIAVLVLWTYHAPKVGAPAWAIFRGALQLAVISVVLRGVIHNPLWVGVALAVMFAVAASTSARRLGFGVRRLAIVSLGMALGVGVALTIVFLTGAIGFNTRYVLALGGIVIGNAMTIATLAGRRLTEMVHDRWDEVEGWLALGSTPRQSTVEQARAAVYAALIPTTDQTRTTGLVTLPGAFVGAIFGGTSPLEAGRFQIVVLAAIMGGGALTAVAIVHALAPMKVRPAALT